jgi:hypothetical protein
MKEGKVPGWRSRLSEGKLQANGRDALTINANNAPDRVRFGQQWIVLYKSHYLYVTSAR